MNQMNPPFTARHLPVRRMAGQHTQRGVTLIEILITLLVLAVGLLGLAALQGISLQTGQTSYYRTQATNIAYEVADFGRSNRSVANAAFLEGLGDQLAGQRLPGGTTAVTLDRIPRTDRHRDLAG